jgi:diguanylate cyclase (GGDEF)-like protein/PAS domain S-box-containing protein
MLDVGGEEGRLAALQALNVLDSAAEPEFDLITELAAQVFNVPIALLSMVDANRQWFKARQGLDVCETDRGIAFCNHAIRHEGVFEVRDATADPRFSGNPLVTGEPNIRYYAGVPLKLRSGHRIGTLCIIDCKARAQLDPAQRRTLTQFAELATIQLELRRLRQIGSMSAAMAGATPDAIVLADADGFIIQWNPAAERMFGYSQAEALDMPLEKIMPPEFRPAHNALFSRLMGGGAHKLVGKTVEIPALRRHGERFPTEISLAAWNDPDGQVGGVGAIIRDVSAKKQLEADKDETKRFLDTVLEHLPAMLFVKDARSREYLLWNKAGEAATGLQRGDVLGRTDEDLFPGFGADFMTRDELTLRTMLPQTYESRFTRADAEERVLRTRRIAVPDENGEARYLLGISEDVTRWREAQDRLLFLAGHDPLTHLLNRVSFEGQLDRKLADGTELAIVALDLDRFKAVNDGHGHHVGDRLLQGVATILQDHVPLHLGALAARLAGDEFAILLAGPGARDRAARTAGSLLRILSRPLDLDGISLRINASIGIAVAPDHGTRSAVLMANADLALYRAKTEGRGRYRFFDLGMDQAARERRRVEAKLRDAIAGDAIRLHFQPLASLETGQVVAFEALARWHDPDLGEVRPDIFIPIAEETGLIGALGSSVLRMAIAEAASWAPPLGISVNLSPIQVQSPDFCKEVAALLAEFDFPAGRLELEVTEGVMISDAEGSLATLRQLKGLGISIAMDDFGTGYSSLSYFRLFPFDKVKIDQSFVRDMGSSTEALAIVQAVIGLARGLGLPVVAEGVENNEQFNMLLAEGCTQVQGYLLGRPAPIESFLGTALTSRSGAMSAESMESRSKAA